MQWQAGRFAVARSPGFGLSLANFFLFFEVIFQIILLLFPDIDKPYVK
jgi:hypothetical protein